MHDVCAGGQLSMQLLQCGAVLADTFQWSLCSRWRAIQESHGLAFSQRAKAQLPQNHVFAAGHVAMHIMSARVGNPREALAIFFAAR